MARQCTGSIHREHFFYLLFPLHWANSSKKIKKAVKGAKPPGSKPQSKAPIAGSETTGSSDRDRVFPLAETVVPNLEILGQFLVMKKLDKEMRGA